jgi:polyribonucleotide nucleotidyltransferase
MNKNLLLFEKQIENNNRTLLELKDKLINTEIYKNQIEKYLSKANALLREKEDTLRKLQIENANLKSLIDKTKGQISEIVVQTNSDKDITDKMRDENERLNTDNNKLTSELHRSKIENKELLYINELLRKEVNKQRQFDNFKTLLQQSADITKESHKTLQKMNNMNNVNFPVDPQDKGVHFIKAKPKNNENLLLKFKNINLNKKLYNMNSNVSNLDEILDRNSKKLYNAETIFK